MREFVAKVDDMTRLAAGKIVSARNVRDRFMLFFSADFPIATLPATLPEQSYLEQTVLSVT